MPVVIVLLVLIILAELFLLTAALPPGASRLEAAAAVPLRPPGYHDKPIFRENSWRPSAVPLNTATALSWTSI